MGTWGTPLLLHYKKKLRDLFKKKKKLMSTTLPTSSPAHGKRWALVVKRLYQGRAHQRVTAQGSLQHWLLGSWLLRHGCLLRALLSCEQRFQRDRGEGNLAAAIMMALLLRKGWETQAGDVQVTAGAGTRRVDYQNSDPEWIYNELPYTDDTG